MEYLLTISKNMHVSLLMLTLIIIFTRNKVVGSFSVLPVNQLEDIAANRPTRQLTVKASCGAGLQPISCRIGQKIIHDSEQ